MMRIVLLAAMPQESRPLLRLLGRSRTTAGAPFPTWFQRSAHMELIVVETGMGEERARRAARHVLTGPRIDLLVSMGFAGSLWPGFRVGQVVWSRGLATYDGLGESPTSPVYRSGSSPGLTAFLQSRHVEPACFLTVDKVRSKAGMAGRFAEEPTIVEMESTPIAAEAYGRRVPFLGLRAISDESVEEIEWELDVILDGAGRVRPARVLSAIVRRPALLGSLFRLWRGSQVAGRTLAQTVIALLQLPEEDLRVLAEQLQLLPMP